MSHKAFSSEAFPVVKAKHFPPSETLCCLVNGEFMLQSILH